MTKKRIFALLLCAAMLLSLLAGCGSSSSSSDTSDTDETEEAEEAEEETTEEVEEEATEEEAAEEEEEEEEVVIGPDYYYLSDETIEISLMFQYASFFSGFFTEGWISSPWWEALGEVLNCTFTLYEMPNTTYTEKLNLAIVAGDCADLIGSIGNAYSTGASGALQDEVILDMRDYLEEYAPNYWALLSQDEDTLRSAMTDDSEMPVIYTLSTEQSRLTDGLWVRQDWLDELGYEVPSTLDEFYEFLVACKDAYGCTAAYYQMITTGSTTPGITAEGIWNAFGPTDYYLKEDGTVGYGPSEDYYFDYLEYLQKLANAGVFTTSDLVDDSSSELFAQSNIAINGDSPENIPDYLSLLDDDTVTMTPMAALGDPTEYRSAVSYINSDGVATAQLSVYVDCEFPELIAKMTDYLYTEEGSMLASYGIEGLSYEMVDGEPQYTELITDNPDGIPVRAALGYWTDPGLCALIVAGRTDYTLEDWQLEAYDLWETAYTGSSGTLNTSGLSFTTDEQDFISMYKSDMITYITQFVYQVVFSDVELTDETKQEYLDTLENTFHLSEVLELYQDAYERYLARDIS